MVTVLLLREFQTDTQSNICSAQAGAQPGYLHHLPQQSGLIFFNIILKSWY